MSDVSAVKANVVANLEDTANPIFIHVEEATDSLCITSKEKYERKAKLIEAAEDMTTREKLEALDQNYDRHNQEVWLNVLIYGAIGLLLFGAITKQPVHIKNTHRLAA